MKLELKHIAGYLPYSISFQFEDNMNHYLRTGVISSMQPCIDDTELTLIDDEFEGQEVLLSECKLILQPLSDLYKPLEDGSVPIVELAKIIDCGYSWAKVEGNIAVSKHYTFEYNKWGNFVYSADEYTQLSISLEKYIQLFDYLYSHHFDLHGLIEKGLALDINQIKE